VPGFIPFKELAEAIDVTQVAQQLGLQVKQVGKDLRSSCPVCSDDPRALQLFPETNSFRCHSASLSGDCIALYAHVMNYQGMYKAAKELGELFGTANAGRNNSPTAPQAPTGRTAKSQPAPPQPKEAFDPATYLTKLKYSDELKQLGISEADAERLGIGIVSQGFHRGRIVFAIRDETGAIAGFIGVNGTDVKVPDKWLLSQTNIVPLRRA